MVELTFGYGGTHFWLKETFHTITSIARAWKKGCRFQANFGCFPCFPAATLAFFLGWVVWGNCSYHLREITSLKLTGMWCRVIIFDSALGPKSQVSTDDFRYFLIEPTPLEKSSNFTLGWVHLYKSPQRSTKNLLQWLVEGVDDLTPKSSSCNESTPRPFGQWLQSFIPARYLLQ